MPQTSSGLWSQYLNPKIWEGTLLKFYKIRVPQQLVSHDRWWHPSAFTLISSRPAIIINWQPITRVLSICMLSLSSGSTGAACRTTAVLVPALHCLGQMQGSCSWTCLLQEATYRDFNERFTVHLIDPFKRIRNNNNNIIVMQDYFT